MPWVSFLSGTQIKKLKHDKKKVQLWHNNQVCQKKGRAGMHVSGNGTVVKQSNDETNTKNHLQWY